jgi:hypothetical protein
MAVNKPDPITNLGHKGKPLTKNSAGMVDYTNNDIGKKMLRQPSRLQGVYTSCSDPRSGISSADNLGKWSDYATKDSYHRGPGPGKDPPVSDRQRQHVPAAGKDSDGYLQSTQNWPNHEFGADSGPGRIEKTHRK